MANPISSARTSEVFYSSLVVELIVPKGQDWAFYNWHQSLEESAKQHAGFLRMDLTPPLYCADPIVKWYSILHFDSPEHLHDWMESPDRQAILESGQNIFHAYRFKSFTTGLEGWFSRRFSNSESLNLQPPQWKQILTVVLGLYPVVMLQSKMFTTLGILQTEVPAITMLLNNLITSTILSLWVMPKIAKFLRFWLQPAYWLTSRTNNLIGTMMITMTLIIMVIIFHHF